MRKMIVPASAEELANVQSFIDSELEAHGFPAREQLGVDIAVEEIFVNIATYAYTPEIGEAEVTVDVADDAATPENDATLTVTVTFSDGGKPFDPLKKEDADTSPEALMGREGGLGILMTKRIMDELEYSYERGRNILTMKKRIVR